MIQKAPRNKQWQRRLTLSRGFHDTEREIGEDIGVLSYTTMESLGTERRVQVLCSGEPLLEIHQDDSGYINVEVQGLDGKSVRVIITPLAQQQITDMDKPKPASSAPGTKRMFELD